MLEQDIIGRGISDPHVIEAITAVPREDFVPQAMRSRAYDDGPLPIGEGQTISQPYIVAFMSEQLQAEPGDKILEIGTGSGYQAAVLARMGLVVYTIEIVKPLYETARKKLAAYGLDDDHVRLGNGYAGIPEHAPYDGIIVTAAPEEIPQALVEQLAVGGRMVIPVGPTYATQKLLVLGKNADGSLDKKDVLPVRFVPMTGDRTPDE